MVFYTAPCHLPFFLSMALMPSRVGGQAGTAAGSGSQTLRVYRRRARYALYPDYQRPSDNPAGSHQARSLARRAEEGPTSDPV